MKSPFQPGEDVHSARGRDYGSTNSMIWRSMACLFAALAFQFANAQIGLFVGSDFGAFTEKIVHYDGSSGQYIKTMGTGDHIVDGLAFGPDNMLYVAESLEFRAIVQYDPVTGQRLKTFSRDGNLVTLQDLAIGPDGDLYACANYSSIYRYDLATGAWKGAFVEQVASPSGVAFMPDGDLLVADYNGGIITRYDGQTGADLGVFAATPEMQHPYGIRYGPDGNLYVPDRESKKIHRFHGITGEYLGLFATAQWEARGLAFGPNGNLFVADGWYLNEYDGVTGAYVGVFAFRVEQRQLSSLAFGPVPEPASILALGVGVAALAARRRHSK